MIYCIDLKNRCDGLKGGAVSLSSEQPCRHSLFVVELSIMSIKFRYSFIHSFTDKFGFLYIGEEN